MGKAADPALLGRTIAGKFAIESFIGGGAMGQVYKARQLALDKTVALKVMNADLASDDTFARRFQREAHAASRLDHPNSMRVLDFGQEADGLLYIAMEFVDGRDLLRVILDDWPLSAERVASITMQTLAALAVAHDLGIVHRDLKPENIMVLQGTDDEGRPTDVVKVCDFGIAKMTVRSNKDTGGGVKGALTTQGLVVGTPEYMSPEQGKGESLDARSDLYSVGVILFQLLTGRVPFEAESALGVVLKHVTEPPPLPSSINPTVNHGLEMVCLKAMRKAREDRYQTAREMRSDLRRAVQDAPRDAMASGSDLVAPPVMANAATLQAGVPHFGSDRGGPRSSSTGTPSGTTAVAPAPRVKPLWRTLVFSGVGALVVGIGVAVLFGVGKHAAEPTLPAPATPPMVSVAPLPAEPQAELPPLTPDPGASASAGGAAAPAKAASNANAAKHPAAPVNAAQPLPMAPAMATVPSAASSAFDLTTASADPRVTKAEGLSAPALRKALPALQFTLCYRDALKKAGKRFEGQLTLHLTFKVGGGIEVLLSGPAPLPALVGSCIQSSLSNLPAQDLAPNGGSADVTIALVPE